MTSLKLLYIALTYLVVINVVTFFMYGIDKWRSTSLSCTTKRRGKCLC